MILSIHNDTFENRTELKWDQVFSTFNESTPTHVLWFKIKIQVTWIILYYSQY